MAVQDGASEEWGERFDDANIETEGDLASGELAASGSQTPGEGAEPASRKRRQEPAGKAPASKNKKGGATGTKKVKSSSSHLAILKSKHEKAKTNMTSLIDLITNEAHVESWGWANSEPYLRSLRKADTDMRTILSENEFAQQYWSGVDLKQQYAAQEYENQCGALVSIVESVIDKMAGEIAIIHGDQNRRQKTAAKKT